MFIKEGELESAFSAGMILFYHTRETIVIANSNTDVLFPLGLTGEGAMYRADDVLSCPHPPSDLTTMTHSPPANIATSLLTSGPRTNIQCSVGNG